MGGFYVGECPRISPFLKNNGPPVPSGPWILNSINYFNITLNLVNQLLSHYTQSSQSITLTLHSINYFNITLNLVN
jgi:hypothetical protein